MESCKAAAGEDSITDSISARRSSGDLAQLPRHDAVAGAADHRCQLRESFNRAPSDGLTSLLPHRALRMHLSRE